MTNSKTGTGCPQVDDFIRDVRTEKVRTNQWIPKACDLIEKELNQPDTWIDQDKTDKAIELGEKYFFPLFPWQKLVVALVHAYRRLPPPHTEMTVPVWSRFDLVIGRGSGKNGFISFLIWYFTTPYHGIREYDVDLVANSETQAMRSYKDVTGMLDLHERIMSRQFIWNMTEIRNIKTNSTIIYNTSSGKTADGKRTGCVIFDEYHAYENYNTLSVYLSGLGKKPHPREFWITSNGQVRGAVFDTELEANQSILNGEREPNGRLPLLWMQESEEDVQDEANWEISMPSLPYFPELLLVSRKQWVEAQTNPATMQEFMTKRMNLPLENQDLVVTSWENILAASQPLPDLRGRDCVLGIDYAKTTDFVSAGLWFRDGEKRYYIKKTWVCKASADLPRIKAPINDWAREGYLELVDDVEISPKRVAAWVQEMQRHYNIIGAAIDDFRYTLMSEALEEIGFVAKDTLRLVRGNQIMKTSPVITSLFANQNLIFGDDPEMRWSVNNAKLISSGRDKDLGNYTFGKIEPKSRKTDSFMGMVQASTLDHLLTETTSLGLDLPVMTW